MKIRLVLEGDDGEELYHLVAEYAHGQESFLERAQESVEHMNENLATHGVSYLKDLTKELTTA